LEHVRAAAACGDQNFLSAARLPTALLPRTRSHLVSRR
jgi:hypothetical protein